ncbi:MAG: carboxymuconolactone decarboxylase family protein [Chitinophagaceae bacterium]|jgi:4-carboxymuconolactone decarboxylase|nr:carboxymuconolactone decarboxylase family protein [Chitinophagaceae bacterium]
MKKIKILICLLLLVNQIISAQAKKDNPLVLSIKEHNIIIISAFTANGDIAQLKPALHNGLNAGLTINEVKEILVQLYAYAGFPRSLNALTLLMSVVKERKEKGITDVEGKEPTIVTTGKNMLQTGEENRTKLTGTTIEGGVYDFVPVIDQFLKEHLFGAIFSRNNLDWKTRELITIAALAAMNGTEAQLRSHYNVGIYNGLSISQLNELVKIIQEKVNKHSGIIAGEVLQSLIKKEPYKPSTVYNELIFSKGQKIETGTFTGNAWLNQLIPSDSVNKTQVGSVTFEPGARTYWHIHPAGQILMVIDGIGYYQEKGNAKRILQKGDVVKCPPNIPHWHGASKEKHFIQVAITNTQNGSPVWLQPVTDEEYNQQ